MSGDTVTLNTARFASTIQLGGRDTAGLDIPPRTGGCLRLVRQPQDGNTGSVAEIIAIHGLHSSFHGTWCKGDNDGTLGPWVRDLLPFSRLFAYEGTLDFSSDQSLLDPLALRRAATSLLADLSRKVDQSKAIVFLCHNVAGILVKELLWIANQNSEYVTVAVNTRALVLFGTPDVSSDWDDVLLKLVLATNSDSGSTPDQGEAHTVQRSIRELVQRGPSALKACSLRYEMIQKQYKTICIFEGMPTDGIGKVVRPTQGHDPSMVIQMPHSRLCLTDVLKEEVVKKVKEVTATARKEGFEIPMLSCRRKLAACYEFHGSLADMHHGASGDDLIPTPHRAITAWPIGITTIRGSAGSGKSVRASQIASSARASSDSGAVVLSFYFSHGHDGRSSYRDLLLSLLLQLLYSEEALMETPFIQRLAFALLRTITLSNPDLYRLFSAILIKLAAENRDVICVVDALDECDRESRMQLMGDFKRLAVPGLTSCRMIVTCRPHADILAHLGPFTEDNSVHLDVEMKQTRNLLMEKKLTGDKLARVREVLERENATPLRVKLAASLASQDACELADYTSVYNRLLAEIDAPPDWLQEVLLCVAFAKRPLTVGELAAAMGVDAAGDFRQTLGTIRVASPKRLQEDLERALGALLVIENNLVYLVHGTLRDLIREQPETLFHGIVETSQATPMQVPRRGGQRHPWSSLIWRKCMLTISVSAIRELYDSALAASHWQHPFPFDNLSDPLPSLVSYAGRFWLRHMTENAAQVITAGESAQIEQDFYRFWDEPAARGWWLKAFVRRPDLNRPAAAAAASTEGLGHLLVDDTEFRRSAELEADNASELLRAMASLGLRPIVKSLLGKHADALQRSQLLSGLEAATRLGDAEMTSQFLKAADAAGHDLRLDAVNQACLHGHAGLVQGLLSHWAPEEGALSGSLAIASEAGHWHIVAELLEGLPGSQRLLEPNQAPALLRTAAREGRDGVVSELLTRWHASNQLKSCLGTGATRTDLDIKDKDTHKGDGRAEDEGQPPTKPQLAGLNQALYLAAEYGSAATVRLLVRSGADIESRDRKGFVEGWAALHYAAAEGNIETIEQLLEEGANIECLDSQDATPLLLAVLGEHVHTVRALLDKGANLDHAAGKSAKYRALHLAARTGNVELTRLLLVSGASENAKLAPPDGNTPLHLAVSHAGKGDGRHAQVVRTLLRLGADVDAQNGMGETALHLALENTKDEYDPSGSNMVKVLVAAGADIDKLDNSNCSPLYYAMKKSHRLAADLWDPNGGCTEIGVSALFLAAAYGLTDRVRQLLNAGHDVTERDKWGRIALDVVTPRPAPDHVRLLLTPPTHATPHQHEPRPPAADEAKSHPPESLTTATGKGCSSVHVGMIVPIGERLYYYCDRCKRRFEDEMFYHCCDCALNCAASNTFEMCLGCFQRSSCKEQGHRYFRRFVGSDLTSWEELSPNFDTFGPASINQDEPGAVAEVK